MSFAQKWALALVGLGAAYLVAVHPDAAYKAATGLQRLTAGSVVAVTTGGTKGLA